MKKPNNKGFSLVELIIVIAIMAILAGAIAPALIKYIDKSRKSNDVSSAKTIKTAVETALGTESVYETLTNTTTATKIVIVPGKTGPSTDTEVSTTVDYIKITGCSKTDTSATGDECAKLIASNIGEKMPKAKYQKIIDDNGEKANSGIKPTGFVAFITKGGTVSVYVAEVKEDGSSTATYSSSKVTKGAQLTPEVCKGYQ